MTLTRPSRSTRRRPARSRAALVVVAGFVTALALSGCSQQKLGAAVVMDGRAVITVDELQQSAQDHLAVVPETDPGDAQLAILQRRIVSELIDQVARDNGVRVRDARVAAERDDLLTSVKGRRELVRRLAASDQPIVLAPEDIDRWVKDRLLFNAVATRFAGVPLTSSDPAAQEAVVRVQTELQQASADMDIEVNPRYGSWDPRSGITPLVSGGLSKTEAELRSGGS
ncbi:MAG TPA: hypothetical protein VF423_13425 [Actinomycetes bacterium]